MHRSFFLRAIFVALVASIGLVTGSAGSQAGTTGTMSGIVTDGTGAALAGVSVTVNSPSQQSTATTDSKGSFAFLSLAPDNYTVTLKKSGYADSTTTGVNVTSDQSLTLSFNLQKAP